ncbi:stage III sporulation protein AA [Oceanobacillus limi]|uniref:Stage III sporulation protein AA n=1 Tax=Oceanobacillus limi TaxID=930131 RepID=A0A1H9ZN41_9BACI|nr:stage III sporulation protein AA [Oceanobacillus limi]SES82974.1 stage III sporulation protein AA [Oceanobacillus limi]
MREILRLFPEEIQQAVQVKLLNRWDKLQEIRLRLNQPIELIFDDGIEWLLTSKPTRKDGMYLINQLSEFSLYRLEDELREGYITIEGGHRVGLSGKVNTLNGSVKAIQHISFMNIRIAKEKIGVAKSIIPYLYDNGYLNTLFVGAPQTGKTTLIRDVTRIMSTGWGEVAAQKVGVIDERSEIAASIKGIPQHNLGLRTDVMDACPKAEGMMMMIRSMSPEILVVDEIGNEKDVDALLEAINAGVVVVCTIHGQTLDELKKRPSLQPLLHQSVFQRVILLESNRPGTIHRIYNEKEENIIRQPGVLTR